MTALAFDARFDPVIGKPETLSPLVRRVVCGNPGPFTFKGTNSYIVGRGRVAVIDPGPEDEVHLDALLAAVAGETVTHILVTHTHRDHSPLAERLAEATGAATYGFGPHGAGRAARAIASGDITLDAAGDHRFVPDHRLVHGDAVDGDGWTLEAVFTPGHCSNHMAFALREEAALFSGDHVMAWATSVIAPPDGNMADYFASLRTLIDRPQDRLYLPGHGPVRRQPRKFVRAFLTHRQMREQAILERIRRGERRISDIVRAVYSGLDPRLHSAAGLSTLAHVEHLIEQGSVATDGMLSLDGQYHPAG